ncbi:hypothetical protein HDU96_009083 [Phlyctochytrium bullatum]|nr:hypothetical protein HDU96_009083 [Phlyctochytrium bullatum]
MSSPPTPPYAPDPSQSSSAGISSSAHPVSCPGSVSLSPAADLASVNLAANFHTKGITPFTGDADTFLAWHAQLRNLIAMSPNPNPNTQELVLVDARLQGFIRFCLHPTIQTEFEFYTTAKDLWLPSWTLTALRTRRWPSTIFKATTPQAALDNLLETIANHGRQFETLMTTHQLSADHRLALNTLAMAPMSASGLARPRARRASLCACYAVAEAARADASYCAANLTLHAEGVAPVPLAASAPPQALLPSSQRQYVAPLHSQPAAVRWRRKMGQG